MKILVKALILAGLLLAFLISLAPAHTAQALIPPNQHYVRYLYTDGSFAYFGPTNENYVKKHIAERVDPKLEY